MKAWYISMELRRARRLRVMRDPRSVIPRSSRDGIVDFGSAPLVPITIGSTLPGSCRSCFASVGINGVCFFILLLWPSSRYPMSSRRTVTSITWTFSRCITTRSGLRVPEGVSMEASSITWYCELVASFFRYKISNLVPSYPFHLSIHTLAEDVG